MGAVPEEYAWVRAAKYLGVPVWDLLARPDGRWWCHRALAMENAETLAQQDRAKLHRKR